MIAPRFVLPLAAAFVLAAGHGALAQNGAIGVVSSVVKEVKLSNAQSPKAKQVAVKQRIALGDLIQTGKASQLQLLLLDRSSFSIGASASLRIDRFVYDPARGRSSGATVARGAFRFMSGQQNRANSGSINTPVATIGIRGTIIDGVVGEAAREIAKGETREVRNAKADAKTATLIVLRGPGSRTAPGADVGEAAVASNGVSVDLTEPMSAVYVPRAGSAPIGPFRLSGAGLAKLQDQIFPRQAVGGNSAAESILGGILSNLPGIIGGGGSSGRANTGTTAPVPTNPNNPAGKPPRP
ncbi:FecR family protein [Novosphingobium aquae]|uniref:FecR domain-containing protein n=1 Tax=Novosphingobium aquae TaxID=3133435 RepID=A0ABU8SDN1_9SPHN